jgi:serine/threonine protein kinase
MTTRRQNNNSDDSDWYRKLQEFDPERARKLRELLEPSGLLGNRYRLCGFIGKGGFGQIFRARDIRINRVVVIKVLYGAHNEKQRQEINAEATILGNLDHPALPNLFDYFSEGEFQFLVMKFIKGTDFRKLLKRQGKTVIDFDQIFRWVDSLLSAVHYLHIQRQPIIHRDIKPSNLILTKEGNVVLLDFGLAKGEADLMSLLPETRKTIASVAACTKEYAPLEQLNGSGTDARSDIFSLCATFYHLFTGKMPCKTAAERWHARQMGLSDPLPSARDLNSAVSEQLSKALAWGMAIELKDRPASVAELRAELDKARAEMIKDREEMVELVYRIKALDVRAERAATDEVQEPAEPSVPVNDMEDKEFTTLRQADEDEKLRTREQTRCPEEDAVQRVAEDQGKTEEEADRKLADEAAQRIAESIAARYKAEEEARPKAEEEEEVGQPAPPVSMNVAQAPIEAQPAQRKPVRRKQRWQTTVSISALLLLLIASTYIGVRLYRWPSTYWARNVLPGPNYTISSESNWIEPIDNTRSDNRNSNNTGAKATPSPLARNDNTHLTPRTLPPPIPTPGSGPGLTSSRSNPDVFKPSPEQKKLLTQLIGPGKIKLNHPDRTGAVAIYNKGVNYEKGGNTEEAVKAYDSAAVLKPNFIEALINGANSQAKMGKLDKALELYDDAFKAYGEVASRSRNPIFLDWIYFNRGVVSLLQKMEAVEKFNKAATKKNRNEALEKRLKSEKTAEDQYKELKKRKSPLAQTLYEMMHSDKHQKIQPDKRQPPQPRLRASINANTRRAPINTNRRRR